MTGSCPIQRILAVLLWMVSVIIPFVDSLFSRAPVQDESKDGLPIPWLSLPVGLGFQTEPLNGWNRFSFQDRIQKKIDVASAKAPGLESPDSDPSDLPSENSRIQIYGLISEGDSPVYCFYDSARDHWFRLTVGGVDPESKVHLFQDHGSTDLHLMDLERGKRFLVHQGNWNLTPLSESISGI